MGHRSIYYKYQKKVDSESLAPTGVIDATLRTEIQSGCCTIPDPCHLDAAGEAVWRLAWDRFHSVRDPCRTGRQVKQFAGGGTLAAKLLHLPAKPAGVALAHVH